VSKTLRRLEDLNLITRQRDGNRTRIHVLDESGSGEPYERPTTSDDLWDNLPHAYWTESWHLS
jgi:hypothetical protein